MFGFGYVGIWGDKNIFAPYSIILHYTILIFLAEVGKSAVAWMYFPIVVSVISLIPSSRTF